MNIREQIYRINRLMMVMTEGRVKFSMVIPEDIMGIKEVFKAGGYELYLVGGAVRDAVMGKSPKDYDLVTNAVPDVVEDILGKAGYRTLPTGKAFGVINVFTAVGEYEIATMREDKYGGDNLNNFKNYLKTYHPEKYNGFIEKIMK